MIGIARGLEPAALKQRRETRLAKALLVREANHGALPLNYSFTGYEVVREPLWEAQRRRCAYCEIPIGLCGYPREHFRPKDGAGRDLDARPHHPPGRWDADPYWWLAWTWENLLLACPGCNTLKANCFPVNGIALRPMDFDLSREDPLLLDPCRDDPLDHIVWVPKNPHAPPEDWEWKPESLNSARGSTTILALHLDRRDVVILVSDDLRRNVVRLVIRGENRVRRAAVAEVRAAWDGLLDELLFEGAPYAAARWSALTYLQSRGGSPFAALPAPPRPGRHDPPTVPEGLPPAPAGVPDAAWWRLLAEEELNEAVVMILRAAPMTAEALHSLLRSPPSRCRWSRQTLNDQLSALIGAGQLVIGPHTTFTTP